MSKLRDAARQALEALKKSHPYSNSDRDLDKHSEAIHALRSALAELEYKDMSNNTPEALRLARMIEHYNAGVGSQRIVEDYQQAADELRRLYFENEKLRAALAEQPGYKLVPEVPTNEWINTLARRQTGSFEDVPFAEIHQCIAELLESAPEAPQPAKQPLTREEIFELAEPFGEFKYGDAQGHKRIDFANAIIAAYERKNGVQT